MDDASSDDLRPDGEAPSDHVLLDRFRTGEQDAAAEIHARYAERLEALVSSQTAADLRIRFDPEDVVQSVFRTLFRRVSHGLYDVPAGEELWQLLLVLALNKTRKLASYHRAQKRDVAKTCGSDRLEHSLRHIDGREETAHRILELIVEDLVGDLPEAHRQIVRLRIEGHRSEEISRATERSKRTVERVLQEFRQKLGVLIDARTSSPNTNANGNANSAAHAAGPQSDR
jgi:RNA polymerase sigma-70 factor (ECF subfamily)